MSARSATAIFGRMKPHPPLVGIRNIGNTCFLGCLLQGLASLQPFLRHLRKLDPRPDTFTHKLVMAIEALQMKQPKTKPPSSAMFLGLAGASSIGESNPYAALDPSDIHEILLQQGFRAHEQQDAQETFHKVMKIVEAEADKAHASGDWGWEAEDDNNDGLGLLLLSPSAAPPLYVPPPRPRQPFQGLLASVLTCTSCNVCKPLTHSPFLDLSLPLPPTQRRSDGSLSHPTLSDCLRCFTATEWVSGVECENCSQNRSRSTSPVRFSDSLAEAKNDHEEGGGLFRRGIKRTFTKELKLSRLPRLLCLHLCRRGYGGGSNVKAVNHVGFDLKLKLEDAYTLHGAGKHPYQLQAVVEHDGSAEGGHYTTYRRLEEPFNVNEHIQQSSNTNGYHEHTDQSLKEDNTSESNGRDESTHECTHENTHESTYKSTHESTHENTCENTHECTHESPCDDGSGWDTETGRWFLMDDGNVVETPSAVVRGCQAFLLFYQRMGLDESDED